MSELRITMPDLRAAKMCSAGARRFFMRHELDWNDFLKNGIELSKIEATGDALALKVVESVRGKP